MEHNHTFTLPITPITDAVTLDEGIVEAILDQCDDEYNLSVYDHTIDGGELGELSVDLEDVDADLSDYLHEMKRNVSIEDPSAYLDFTECDDEQEFTLKSVREAYCEQHEVTGSQYIGAVVEEYVQSVKEAAAQKYLDQGKESRKLFDGAMEEIDEERASFAKKERDLVRFRNDLLWAVGVMSNMQLSEAAQERIRGILSVMNETSETDESEEVKPADTEEVA